MKKSLLYHSVGLTFITVLIVIVGVFGSLYSKEISEIFPFSLNFYKDSYTPYIFWLLLLGTALIFFIRQKREDEEQKSATSELLKTIRTLPPKDFLNTFATSFNEVYALKLAGLATNDIPSIEKFLRSMLKIVLLLIQKYDRSIDDINYGVNIMIYRDREEIKSEEEIIKNILFWDEGNLNNLKGILELNKQLSVSSDTIKNVEIDIDKNIKGIILPVPQNIESKTSDKLLSNLLPGAPMAFVKDVFSRFSDVKDIDSWCAEESNFTPAIKSQIHSYFLVDNLKYFSAFASASLPKGTFKVKGVVNIHSDKPGLLSSEESLINFYSILLPIITQITELLEHYESI